MITTERNTNVREWKKVLEKFKGGKYALLVLLLGLLLLLLPKCSGGGSAEQPGTTEQITAPIFDLEQQEERLALAVSSIAGAGETRVVLAMRSSVARELAAENGEAVIVSTGSGKQAPVELRYVYPEYQGALVICEGAADPRVRLAVTEAVQAVTGLGANRITVVQMA